MKIPKSGASRLSESYWLDAEALRLYLGKTTIKETVEYALANVTMGVRTAGSGKSPTYDEIRRSVAEEHIQQKEAAE